MQQHAQALSAGPALTSFEITFPRGHLARNAFKLYGKGVLHIDGDRVTISGKRHRLFRSGQPVTHDIAQRDIFDVEALGAAVYFDIWGGTRTTPLRLALTAASRADADAIAAALSPRQTHDFIKAQAEHAVFATQLEKASTRVWVTPLIIGLNLLVFALMALAGAGVFSAHPEVAIRWGSNYGPMTLKGQWWRLLTSTFIHFGLLHLAVNMIALAQAGPIVERLYGSARFLLLYVGAGLAGELVSLWWHPMTNGAGASGAIFGVFGGLLAFVLNPRNAVPDTVMKAIRKSTVPIVLINLALGLLYLNIDNAAHLGGLVGGALMGILLARPLPRH
jgi:rhomboid protease GluP